MFHRTISRAMTAAAIGIIGFWTHAASAIGIDIYAYEDGSDVRAIAFDR